VGFPSNIADFFSTTRRISMGLGVLKFIRAALTVYTVILSAKYFGASLDRDNWVLAGSAITILTQMMFGPLNEIFRTKFIHIKADEGEGKALAATSSLIHGVVIFSLVVIVLFEIFPGLLSGLLAPGFKGAEREALSQMIRWMMPLLLLSEITLLWIAVLNAYRSYFIPDIYSLVSLVINVVCILILVPYIGIYSLIVANYIGTSILLVILVSAVMKANTRILCWTRPSWNLISPFIVTSFPFYLSYIAGNVQMTLEKMLSTFLGVGNVSILDYSRKFIDMPISVIVGVLTTVLAPTLAEFFVSNKSGEIHREVIKFMRLLIMGLIPFVVLLSVCSREVVELILVRGSFKREFIEVTSQSLSIFSFGAIGYIIYAVGAQSMIAQNRAVVYAVVGTLAMTLSITMNLLLFNLIGLTVFPLSWGVSLFLAGLYMIFCQTAQKADLLRELGKMIGLMLLVTVVCYAVRQYSLHFLFERLIDVKRHDFFVLLATALFGNLIYICSMYLFNFEEIQGLKRYIARKTNDII